MFIYNLKGLYSGQGVLVYSNNGEANQEAYRNFDFEPTGSLNEWNGKDWKLIRRNQFVASHNFRIHDYASYRGLLVMTGIHPDAEAGEHIIR